MKTAIILGLGLLTIGAAGLAFIRLAPNDPLRVHLDPMRDGASGPNSLALRPPDAPVYPHPPDKVFAVLDGIIRATDGVRAVAEGPEPNHASYVARTPILGFPDWVSIRVVGVEGGAAVAVYARARFGVSDLGVNKARIDGWLSELESALADP
ncbi:MAG: DUF1499 domain-containing protein [Pseudomonadota bacterium]